MKSGGSLRLADRREHSCAQARDLATAPLGDVQVKLKDSDMIVQCADGTLPDGPLIEALSRTPETPVSRAEASRP
jgi:MerR family mercuric resistance operon transcriptional regulator